ncbi:MAG: nucleoside permease [Saprospiraceae bacterium]|nr:nucleoside permease [Saprospiraceae bacterium]
MSTNIRVQLSIMMFFQFFIWGCWYVTMGTYFGEIGFQGSDVGNAYSTISLGAIFAPLFVGMIADRFFNAEKVLGALHLIGAGLLYWISTITTPSGVYWALLLYSLCYMPTLAIANAVAFNQMDNPEKEFPAIRVLGTIAWIVAGILIGTMKIEPTAIPFKIAAGFSVLMGIYCFFLPATPPKAKGKDVSVGQLLGFDALKLMKDRSFAVLIIGSLLVSIPLSFYYNFTNPYFNESGMVNAAGKMTMGQMSEIIFLLLMPFFFKKLGVKKMILVGILCWVARYLLFAYGNNEELVFMFYAGIILHGLCYDFFFVTGQIYVDNEAPEAVRSSAQGLIALVTYGLGMYIGSIYSGKVVESHEILNDAGEIIGHNWWNIWMVPAGLAGVVLILFAIFFREKKSEAVEA